MVSYKWVTFARLLLLWELAFFVAWLIAFNVWVILFQVSLGIFLDSH